MYFFRGVYVGRSEPFSCEILVFDVVCNHCSTYEQVLGYYTPDHWRHPGGAVGPLEMALDAHCAKL